MHALIERATEIRQHAQADLRLCIDDTLQRRPRHLQDGGLLLGDDGSLEVEAVLTSLRPPDREPPRLGSLTKEQEAVIVAFLDVMAFDERSAWKDFAMQVMDEYWVRNAYYRKRR